jgi:hypothetical protein
MVLGHYGLCDRVVLLFGRMIRSFSGFWNGLWRLCRGVRELLQGGRVREIVGPGRRENVLERWNGG